MKQLAVFPVLSLRRVKGTIRFFYIRNYIVLLAQLFDHSFLLFQLFILLLWAYLGVIEFFVILELILQRSPS